MKRAFTKSSYTQNDMLVTILLQEISHANIDMLLATKNELDDKHLKLLTSSLITVYSFAIIEDLELNEDEIKLIKSFINRSGKFLSNNLDRLTKNPKYKKLYKNEYEFLLKTAEKFNYKVEESKKLLEKFNKK